MERISQYIVSIVTAAAICSIVKFITGRKFNPIIKMICGLFLLVTILAPVVHMDFSFTDLICNDEYVDVQNILAQSKADVAVSVSSIIKEETEAYILNKAKDLGLDINIEIVLDESNQIPERVILSGYVSPYPKEQLSHYIENTLAIPGANQEWD